MKVGKQRKNIVVASFHCQDPALAFKCLIACSSSFETVHLFRPSSLIWQQKRHLNGQSVCDEKLSKKTSCLFRQFASVQQLHFRQDPEHRHGSRFPRELENFKKSRRSSKAPQLVFEPDKLPLPNIGVRAYQNKASFPHRSINRINTPSCWKVVFYKSINCLADLSARELSAKCNQTLLT